MVRAKAKVNGDANSPLAKSVAVKRFNLSLQLLVPQHEAMEPSSHRRVARSEVMRGF